MRWIRYAHQGETSYGILEGEHITPVRGDPFRGYERTGLRLALSAVKIAIPVVPPTFYCVGLNYAEHIGAAAAKLGRPLQLPKQPDVGYRAANALIAHDEPVVIPADARKVNYEGELAVVIGKQGRHIPAEHALEYVAGYSCYNEGSVRDWQRHTSQFLAGKTFAGTGAFGPWLVTADEIPDPSRVTLETRLNRQVVQRTTTDLMITSIAEQVAYISTMLPLLPGDVIVSGTPGGVGLKRSPQLFMRPGDIAEVEISGIGLLRNPVMAEAA